MAYFVSGSPSDRNNLRALPTLVKAVAVAPVSVHMPKKSRRAQGKGPALAPTPAPAPPPSAATPRPTAAQQWEALYAQVEYMSPGAAERMFERARASRGSWTLDEFKGWFNFNYPEFARAGKFFVLYLFYAFYLAVEEKLRVASQTPQGPRAGGPFRFYATVDNDPNASVVDAVFAKAERKRDA